MLVLGPEPEAPSLGTPDVAVLSIPDDFCGTDGPTAVMPDPSCAGEDELDGGE